MTARRDPDRLIRTFLDDGPDELPDHSYDAVRAHIDHTRQRVVIGPWREPQMSNFARIGIAAAAVLAIAVIGVNLLPGQGPGVGQGPPPAPTAAPSATATAAPSPSPLGRFLPCGWKGPLDSGTYSFMCRDVVDAERFTFTVPDGWAIDEDSQITKNKDEPGEVYLTTWIVSHIFSDACQWEGDRKLVDVGTTVDELVSALEDQEGRQASSPTDVTVGGFPAKRIELTVPADLDTATCTNGNLRYWPQAGPDMSGGMCCNPPGNTDVLYVVDVDGRRTVVVARHYPDSSMEDRAELQAIVDSIEIDP